MSTLLYSNSADFLVHLLGPYKWEKRNKSQFNGTKSCQLPTIYVNFVEERFVVLL